ncbi:hypothetical protein ACFOWM_12160 [Ferruginibacter yonginensis]|uniref:Uncharacterized protein n=1 Tax=Ferruginibacter yonginensis TaxID=1310416 RepID=A0ABV8QXE7_9BACT
MNIKKYDIAVTIFDQNYIYKVGLQSILYDKYLNKIKVKFKHTDELYAKVILTNIDVAFVHIPQKHSFECIQKYLLNFKKLNKKVKLIGYLDSYKFEVVEYAHVLCLDGIFLLSDTKEKIYSLLHQCTAHLRNNKPNKIDLIAKINNN